MIPIIPYQPVLTLAVHSCSAVGNGPTEPTTVAFHPVPRENISDVTRNLQKSRISKTRTAKPPIPRKPLTRCGGWDFFKSRWERGQRQASHKSGRVRQSVDSPWVPFGEGITVGCGSTEVYGSVVMATRKGETALMAERNSMESTTTSGLGFSYVRW